MIELDSNTILTVAVKKNKEMTPKEYFISGIVALSFSIWLLIIPPLGILVALCGLIMILAGVGTYFENKKKTRRRSQDK